MTNLQQSEKNPKISVIMPVFNHSKKQLSLAIWSILNQTFKNFEFIIADGSSSDKNFEVISAIKDDRIKYFREKGYINCLNSAFKMAKGEFIARMDSDDISFPTRLEEQYNFLLKNPDISLCSCLAEFFGDLDELKFSTNLKEINLINLIKNQEFVHPAMMLRRELNLKFDDIKPVEDSFLFRKMLLEGTKFAIINKVLFKNYISKNSIMKKYPKVMRVYMAKINTYALLGYIGFNLSFKEEILNKKTFSKGEIFEFLKFIIKAKKALKKEHLDPRIACRHYFYYMLKHCEKRLSICLSTLYFRAFLGFEIKRFFKKIIKTIFSVGNEKKMGVKRKKVCILGIKIKFSPKILYNN